MMMMAGHIFLNECVPKDYATKVWKTIVGNNIAVEKKVLTEQTQDSSFGILAKQFPEFSSEEPCSAIGKIWRMLCRFACTNCMNFSEVGNQELLFISQLSVVSHIMFPFSLQLKLSNDKLFYYLCLSRYSVLSSTSNLILNNLFFFLF